MHQHKSKKVSYYIAQYPVLRTVQSVLYLTPWQTYSEHDYLDSFGKLSPMLQIAH